MSLDPNERIIDVNNYPITSIVSGTNMMAMIFDRDLLKWIPFATATSNGIAYEKEEIDISNKSQNGWSSSLDGQKSWSGSLSGILYEDPNYEIDIQYLEALFNEGCYQLFAFTPIKFIENEKCGDDKYESMGYFLGKARITNLEFTQDNQSAVTFDMTFEGVDQSNFEPEPVDQISLLFDTTLGDGTTTVQAPFVSGHIIDVVVDWGDGSPLENFTDPTLANHAYASHGQYQVKITGIAGNLEFGGANIDSCGLKLIGVNRISNIGFITNVVPELFGGCSNLTYVNNIDQIISISNTYLRVFFNCFSLSYISGMEKWMMDSPAAVTLQDMFYNCQNLSSVDLVNFNLVNCNNATSMFRNCYVCDIKNIDGLVFGSKVSITSIFRETRELSGNIKLSDIFTSGASVSMQSAFENTKIKSVDFRSFDASEVTAFRDLFADCSDLTELYFDTSIDISLLDDAVGMLEGVTLTTESYSDMLKAFANSPSLQSGVNLDAPLCFYNASAQAARDILTQAPNNWIINDAGLQP